MKTKLDYYRIFYEAAKHSSFSVAAKNLYISQSAISQCISQLESDLETTLFFRSKRGVKLTKEGKVLFKKAESAISLIEQGENMIERLNHLESGSLIIAAGDTVASHYLLPYLEKFHSLYPDIRIEMANSYSQRLIELLKDGKADLAFINLPLNDDEIEVDRCLEIQDVFICGPDYPLKESYTWEEISKEPLILLERNSVSRRSLDLEFQKKGIILSPQIEVAVHDLLIRLSSIHLGISCSTYEFSKEEIESGKIKVMNLVPPLSKRSIGCAYMKSTPLSLASREFLKLIHS